MRSLGKSGLTASEIGLGLAAIGRPGYITLGRDRDLPADRTVEAMRRQAHELLDAAYADGVRYFDAARSYGLAEDFLATWLDRRGLHSGTGPDDVTVGSKWGYRYTADWRVGAEVNEVKDHSLAHLRSQLAESRALFGDRLGLYQIHSATLESGVLEDREVLDELRRLKSEGLAVGLTVSGPKQADVIRRAIEISAGGARLFDTVQATWNLLETSAGPALAEAKAAGLGVIVKEALANGRLVAGAGGGVGAGPGAAGAVPAAAPAPLPEVAPLVQVSARLKATQDAVAIAAALAQPWSDVVLSGAVTPSQIESNVAAANLTLGPADLAALSALAEPPDKYWTTRSALPWT